MHIDMSNGLSQWSDNVWKIVLASIVAAIVIGMSARTLREVDILEAQTSQLKADDEWIKLILIKMADRLNVPPLPEPKK